jgi:hypothetical protein
MISESPTEMIITSGVFHLANKKQNYKQMKHEDMKRITFVIMNCFLAFVFLLDRKTHSIILSVNSRHACVREMLPARL